MIAFIKGFLDFISEENIIIESQGIGYEIRVPASLLGQLPSIGEEIKLFTYLYVREDAMQLYGFLSGDDLGIFKMLLTVNGIGPKGALAILSAITPDELRFAIVTGDDVAISKAPGIGKKTAQKLILDLKDKMQIKDYQSSISKEISNNTGELQLDTFHEAILALVSLGYSQIEASRAVKTVKVYHSVEELIKLALKQLAKF